MEVALKWGAQEIHSLDAELSRVANTSFSLYIIILV